MPGRSFFPVAFALLAAGLLHAAPTAAQAVAVRAYVTPAGAVGVGRPFVLNLEVTGAQTLDQNPVLPELGGFAQYLGSGTSTSVQMAGGRTTVSLTVQYRFQALKEGSFQIEAFDVAVGGQTLTTEPVGLTVAAAPAPGQGSPQGAAGAAGTESATGPGGVAATDLFVTADASSTHVLEGEPFTVEYRIWTRVDVGSYSLTRVPEPEGFWVEDLVQGTQPQVEQIERNGQTYATAVIRRVALVPSGAGSKTLEPLGVEAQVRVRSRGRDPFEDLFGRSSFFGTTMVPTTVLSNEVVIDVEALPAGRPEPFSGVVGTLEVRADLDRDTIDANDAVTLTIRVSGQGNVSAVPAPELALPEDFEVFPPEVTESAGSAGAALGGTKVFSYVMIPRAPGLRAIPSVAMGYYDLEAGGYRTARTDELPLTVEGTAAAVPGGAARGGVAQLREDIRFIHLDAGTLRPRGRVLFGTGAFWMFVLLPMVGVLGSLGLRRHQDRLEGDVAYARGRRAGRVARKRFAKARALAVGQDGPAFYAEVARALRGFIADKLNVAEAGMQLADLGAGLTGRGVSASVVADVLECLERCDRRRFSPSSEEPEEQERFLARASETMTSLDKEVR